MRLDPAYSATAPKVLVIDDDKGLREIIRLTLVPNCEVKTAASVDEGMRIFQELRPDTVIIDYQMPNKDGIQGIKEIREMDRDVPVILLTAFAELEMAREAMELGATEYMTKPFNVTDLKSTVEKCTRLARAKRQGLPVAPDTPRFVISEADANEAPFPGKLETTPRPPTSAPENRVSAVRQDHAQDPGTFPPSSPPLAVTRLFLKENYIETTTPKAVPFRANILRLNPRAIVCEIFAPKLDLQVGDVLTNCKIVLGSPSYFIGKAVVTELVNTGILLVAELALEKEWQRPAEEAPVAASSAPADVESIASAVSAELTDLLSEIDTPFRDAVDQFDLLLQEIKNTLERFELRLRPTKGAQRARAEQAVIDSLSSHVIPAMSRLSDRFSDAISDAPPSREEDYRTYARLQLDPYMLAASITPPTAGRPLHPVKSFALPELLLEAPSSPGSLFEKAFRTWLSSTDTGVAIRYRTQFLAETLRACTQWCHDDGRRAKILSVTAGPVLEIEQFLATEEISDHADITVIGLSEHLLPGARESLQKLAAETGRQTGLRFFRKPVNHFLSEGNRLLNTTPTEEAAHGITNTPLGLEHYNLICCGGLFAHFSDRVCSRIMDIFFELLQPGGFSVVSNFSPQNPLRHFFNYFLDENLEHRTRQELLALAPASLEPEFYRLTEVPNGVETFLHVLKPEIAEAGTKQLELFP